MRRSRVRVNVGPVSAPAGDVRRGMAGCLTGLVLLLGAGGALFAAQAAARWLW